MSGASLCRLKRLLILQRKVRFTLLKELCPMSQGTKDEQPQGRVVARVCTTWTFGIGACGVEILSKHIECVTIKRSVLGAHVARDFVVTPYRFIEQGDHGGRLLPHRPLNDGTNRLELTLQQQLDLFVAKDRRCVPPLQRHPDRKCDNRWSDCLGR